MYSIVFITGRVHCFDFNSFFFCNVDSLLSAVPCAHTNPLFYEPKVKRKQEEIVYRSILFTFLEINSETDKVHAKRPSRKSHQSEQLNNTAPRGTVSGPNPIFILPTVAAVVAATRSTVRCVFVVVPCYSTACTKSE